MFLINQVFFAHHLKGGLHIEDSSLQIIRDNLLTAACQMGVAAAGGSERMLESAGHFGAAIGLAFQIRDDVIDVISTAGELGIQDAYSVIKKYCKTEEDL